jgi:hypothetical protein
VMTSSDEDDPRMEPDKETGMYTAGMDPKAGPHKLSQAEASRQRAAAKAFRASGSPDPVQGFRLSTDAQTFPPEAATPQGVDKSVTRSRAVTDSTPPKSLETPAQVPTKEQQAHKRPRKGQESPETKVSHPMATRTRSASRAGSSGSGGGSGKTDTSVSRGNPSKT